MHSGSDSRPSSIELPPPPAARRSSSEDSREDELVEDQKSPGSRAKNEPEGGVSVSASSPDIWALHQNFLKHLTTIALVIAGGIITLLQSDLIEVEPPFVLSFLPPLLSFILTISAHRNLVKKAGQGASNVPQSTYWVEMAAIALFGAAIGVTASFFLLEVGILPEL